MNHAGLIKDHEVRAFKNEVRISQLESRIDLNERRLSTDSRRLGTLEDTPALIERYNSNEDQSPVARKGKKPIQRKASVHSNALESFAAAHARSPEAIKNIVEEMIDELKKEFSILYITSMSVDEVESRLSFKIQELNHQFEAVNTDMSSTKNKVSQNSYAIEEIRIQSEKDDMLAKLERLENQFGNLGEATNTGISTNESHAFNRKIMTL